MASPLLDADRHIFDNASRVCKNNQWKEHAGWFHSSHGVWRLKEYRQPTLNPDSSGSSKDVGLFIHHPVEPVRHPGEFRRDDIVILRSPEDANRMLIKRVVATEGDTVKTLPPYPDKEVIIPKGHVWVEGDNHFRTDDSNTFGPISEGLIESKLILLLWPPERFGPIPEPSYYLESGKPLDRHMRDALWRQEMRHARVTEALAPEEPGN